MNLLIYLGLRRYEHVPSAKRAMADLAERGDVPGRVGGEPSGHGELQLRDGRGVRRQQRHPVLPLGELHRARRAHGGRRAVTVCVRGRNATVPANNLFFNT